MHIYTYCEDSRTKYVGNVLVEKKLNRFVVSGGLGPHPKFPFNKRNKEKVEKRVLEYLEQCEKNHDPEYIKLIQSIRAPRLDTP